MNIELLLSNISAISEKYDLIYQKTGGYFNIFDIANISSDEVTICRIIYELLNPKGSHYQGNDYLKLFIKHVLKDINFIEQDYKTIRIHREYMISNDRRIDLAIETEDKFIPIEVKIYAEDQVKQCYDYFQYAKNSNLFYLTLDGRSPTPESAEGLEPDYDEENTIIGYKGVSQISFKEDILNWLNKCLELQETVKIAPIREILLQFIGVVRKLTNQMEEGKEMEIINILSSSKENMKNAIEIEKSLKSCKSEMIRKVLKAIESGINREKLINQYDYEFADYKLVNNYYEKKGSSYPGISYFCKSLGNGLDLWFRVEIDHHIFVGFCTPFNDKACGKQLSENEIEIILPKLEPYIDGWWVYWEYLPKDDEIHAINFKEFNDEYLSLFDESTFNSFIETSVNSINYMLDKI